MRTSLRRCSALLLLAGLLAVVGASALHEHGGGDTDCVGCRVLEHGVDVPVVEAAGAVVLDVIGLDLPTDTHPLGGTRPAADPCRAPPLRG